MLCFFKRMTTGLWQARLVKWFMYACIVSYVAVFFTVSRQELPLFTGLVWELRRTDRRIDHVWMLPDREELAVSDYGFHD